MRLCLLQLQVRMTTRIISLVLMYQLQNLIVLWQCHKLTKLQSECLTTSSSDLMQGLSQICCFDVGPVQSVRSSGLTVSRFYRLNQHDICASQQNTRPCQEQYKITTHLLYTIKLPTYVQVTTNETKTQFRRSFTPSGQETDLVYSRDYR